MLSVVHIEMDSVYHPALKGKHTVLALLLSVPLQGYRKCSWRSLRVLNLPSPVSRMGEDANSYHNAYTGGDAGEHMM
jgi:hypothetical protein